MAVVTGGSRGIGFAIARALALEGAKILLSARHEDALREAAETIARESGSEVRTCVADMSDARGPERIVAAAVDAFGAVHIALANAGGPRPGAALAVTEDDFRTSWELTFMGSVRLARAAVPEMKKAGFGRILFLTSVSAVQPIDGLALSNAYRAGLSGFSKTLATELGPTGITVNCIAPGYTATDRTRELFEHRAKAAGRTPAEIEQALVSAIPMRRMAEPREVADVAAFLASERASYVTGRVHVVDGGHARGL